MCEYLEQNVSDPDVSDEGPSGKRWDPVGATNGDDDFFSLEFQNGQYLDGNKYDLKKLKVLEEEQEKLNSSLIALTTHFAQVQFRLKQIVDSPKDKKEELLKELEEFAFRGIPDIQSNFIFSGIPSSSLNSSPVHNSTNSYNDRDSKINLQRQHQKELISQLKSQLEDLEKFAYETGDADLPQSMVLERQNFIMNNLKEKLNFNVEDFSKLSKDDLQWQVDCAINQIVSPIKMKEQLIGQLKTQITDLERFINYLQGEVSIESLACTCACPVHVHDKSKNCHTKKLPSYKIPSFLSSEMSNSKETDIGAVRKVVALLHMYLISQMGCVNQNPKQNKKNNIYNWMNIRTRLDSAVEYVLKVIRENENCSKGSNGRHNEASYDSDSDASINHCNAKITSAVRKYLAVSIRDLMQHGLMVDNTASTSIVPFAGCFVSKRNNYTTNTMHAWDIIMKYYEIKHGESFISSPAQKLSQSFNLGISEKHSISSKQNLLITIGNIISMHSPYKTGPDKNFKAFVCAALNANKLVVWLKLILQCQYILENYYMPWSYVIKTGFQDAFHTLDRLTKYKFDFPIDLAIQHLKNIKEAF